MATLIPIVPGVKTTAPPVVPKELNKGPGDWAVYGLQLWMVVRWPGLLGLNTNIELPDFVLSVLQLLYPQAESEGVALELLQASVDFGINEIPSASAVVAVGRQADRVSVLSAIHYLVKNLKLFLAISLYAKIETRAAQGPHDTWPVDEAGNPKAFRIFDGYITGTGFKKTPQTVEFHCAMIHWLSDLNFSSVLSRSSSPKNPGQISFDPSLPNMPNAGARTPALFSNGHGSALTQAMPLMGGATLKADLWGNTSSLPTDPKRKVGAAAIGVGGIKQWLTEVCRNDRINWREIQFGACGTPPSSVAAKNVEALAALSRIEPLDNGYIDGVPLAMDDRPGLENIAAQIATQIGLDTATLHNHTVWDKLVGQFGPTLLFSLIPQVEKALIVPNAPGLRRHWATVFANDYDYYERSDLIPRPLRGVGLFVGREFAAGGQIGLNNAPVHNTVGAYYENPNRRNGLVEWREAPRWLATIPLPHMYSPARHGFLAATTLDAKKGNVPNQPPPKCKFNRIRALWCDYARSLYIQEILRNRTGRLSGKLRFDIAPGSIIKIEEPEEPFVLETLGDKPSYVFAQALRVSCVLDAERMKAGTAIQFAFTRDEEENVDDSFSLDRHPLWQNNWYGAPLVNDEIFYPGGAPGISPPENKKKTFPPSPC